MAEPGDDFAALRDFLGEGGFATAGAFITDLDGTAVLEREGRIHLPPSVELDLKRVEGLVGQGVNELLVFFYARDWCRGESIWTPQADRVAPVGVLNHAHAVRSAAEKKDRDGLEWLRLRLAAGLNL